MAALESIGLWGISLTMVIYLIRLEVTELLLTLQ